MRITGELICVGGGVRSVLALNKGTELHASRDWAVYHLVLKFVPATLLSYRRLCCLHIYSPAAT
jgi:hypothetical protein